MYREKVHIIRNPLLAHKLSILHVKHTPTKTFREMVSENRMMQT